MFDIGDEFRGIKLVGDVNGRIAIIVVSRVLFRRFIDGSWLDFVM